ncbi:hypothetical protein [Flavobacterium sp. LC2016-12]|uniref:hypothetical protein n=1 Tax=Flavobacterium sp. LC2016-12 TaxID=2783794 RepID=UPI00188AADD1|nr:hypothetical protein [Flavobacterium sp. LC2016-12]MBF4466278.1 hypothetical protein [Flavobacterium sp. LC2016-12]
MATDCSNLTFDATVRIKKAVAYHLPVTLKISKMQIFADDMINPKLETTDRALKSGSIGLRLWWRPHYF